MYCTTRVFSHLAVIMENVNNCGEYYSSVSRCHFSGVGTAFPSILLSFPKTNVQDLHYTYCFAEVLEILSAVVLNTKYVFLLICFHKLYFIFQV